MSNSSCCDGNDPACLTHGVAASNARQNAYWQRVGGLPDAGEVDCDIETCADCFGLGEVQREGLRIECPECNGHGWTS